MTNTTTATSEKTSLELVSVKDIMHVGFFGCALETPLRTVARLMAQRSVHCLVGFGDLSDDDTRLWGLVSDSDVIAALADGRDGASAGDVATSDAVTIEPDASVRRAAELMRDCHVSHLLVVDGRSDRPLGIVSTLDVMALVGGTAVHST